MEIRSPRKKKTLYTVVLATFLLFAFLLIGVLMVGFFSADISSDLEKNNYRFYFSKIENKALELERSMVSKWSSEELIDPVIDIVRNQYALGNAETPFQFTEESAEALISMISEMNASGAFVIVDRGLSSKPALYFRDHNEFNRQASFNDLAMVMGPAEIAASLGIT
ncbi:MAG: hypothetical protein Q4A52_04160, partial [Bacillota bacterium]|nr:hypothetical protein [Bacillota bacterium]